MFIARFNIIKKHIFPTQYDSSNIDDTHHLPVRHSPTGLSNGSICVLCEVGNMDTFQSYNV